MGRGLLEVLVRRRAVRRDLSRRGTVYGAGEAWGFMELDRALFIRGCDTRRNEPGVAPGNRRISDSEGLSDALECAGSLAIASKGRPNHQIGMALG